MHYVSSQSWKFPCQVSLDVTGAQISPCLLARTHTGDDCLWHSFTYYFTLGWVARQFRSGTDAREEISTPGTPEDSGVHCAP